MRLISDIATRPLLIEEGSLRTFNGTLAEYDQPRATHDPEIEVPRPSPPRQPSLPRPDQRAEDLELGLEAAISSKEEALAALGDEINAASERSDVEAVRSLGARFGEAEAELERLLEQWTRVDR